MKTIGCASPHQPVIKGSLFNWLLFCAPLVCQTFGQGTFSAPVVPNESVVIFSNFIGGGRGRPFVDAPVFHLDCRTRLEGPEFLAQLYAGTSQATERELQPVGAAVPFHIGPGAGYWDNRPSGWSGRIIPFVAPGEAAAVQARVYEAAAGSFEAAQRGGGLYGKSNVIKVFTGELALMEGLKSFCLVPEPSPLILLIFALLGIFALKLLPKL